MIDLHCHLLFACDDGPVRAEDSIALAKALRAAGVHTAACSSHIRSDKGWINDLSRQETLHRNLQQALSAGGVEITVKQAAEHYCNEWLFEKPLAGRAVPYENTQWLLVEPPYQGMPADFFGLLFQIRKQGFRILLAHVERFPYLYEKPELLRRLADAGYLMQINLGSLSGVYGREYKKAAEKILLDGYGGILAGDCHHASEVRGNIDEGRNALKKLLGEKAVHQLTEVNPGLLLQNAAPEAIAWQY